MNFVKDYIPARVEIIMGTYNGAKYVRQQVESLLAQTYQDWHLLVGDDQSTDDTATIIQELQEKYPDKISVFLFKHGVGFAQNYSRLLELTNAEYVMFCDQDDFWFPEKIAKSLCKMQEMENRWGKETPLAVHTDMKIGDEELHVIGDSHWKRQKFNAERAGQLNAILVQNVSWGCTMIFNSTLVQLATPIPPAGFVHDDWLALVAAAFGHIGYLEEPTMLYRQHGTNVVGSKEIDFRWFINNVLKDPLYQPVTAERIMKCMVRAYAFYKRYEAMLTDQQKELLEAFIDLKYQPIWKELYLRWKYDFLRHGFWPNVGLLLATIRMGRVGQGTET